MALGGNIRGRSLGPENDVLPAQGLPNKIFDIEKLKFLASPRREVVPKPRLSLT